MNVPAGNPGPGRVPPSHAATGTTCVADGERPPHDDDGRRGRSRYLELLAEMKRKRVVLGQFRVATLMLAMLAISILLAAPRVAGWTYAWYFAILGFVAFAFAPSIAFVGMAWGPWRGPRNRSLVAVACLALAILSGIVAVVWVGSTRTPMPDVILLGLIAILVLFWPLQIVCFWSVWYFLFRKARR